MNECELGELLKKLVLKNMADGQLNIMQEWNQSC